MNATKVKVDETQQPALTRAVIRQTGRENLEDIARYGVDGGFHGFIHYTETVAFFKRNRKAIRERVESMASDLGEEPLAMVAGFRCLSPADTETKSSIARCLYGGRLTEGDTQVANALAWFAAEEISREMNPDL